MTGEYLATAHRMTLILPDTEESGAGFFEVGRLVRREVEEIIISYEFDLRTNKLVTKTAPNANAGREHIFIAYRVDGEPKDSVTLRSKKEILDGLQEAANDDTLDTAFPSTDDE